MKGKAKMKWREGMAMLASAGWSPLRVKGSHQQWGRGSQRVTVLVNHPGHDMDWAAQKDLKRLLCRT